MSQEVKRRLFPSRRDAQQHALLRAGIDEARSDVIPGRDRHLDSHLEIGDSFQRCSKIRDGALLRLDAGGRRWCGSAVLMIDIVLGEKRGEAVDRCRVRSAWQRIGGRGRAGLPPKPSQCRKRPM
jgi:hypothetical protein